MMIHSMNDNKVLKAYAGYCVDESMLKESASGGAASIISESFIRNGGVVYGAVYSDDYRKAHYCRVNDTEGLKRLKGSKYVYVNKYLYIENIKIALLDSIINDIQKGISVLFFGLGCDVLSIQKGLINRNIQTDNIYYIELLCDGVTNEKVHTDYIDKIEKIYASKISFFTVRHKRDGWVPLYIYARFMNGKEHYISFYDSEYGYAFNYYKKKGCYNCPIKNENHHGDIMLGDYWGCTPEMCAYNPLGVSQIFIQTVRGGKLLENVDREKFYFIEIDKEYALKNSPRYFNPHERNKNWDEFKNNINTKNLLYAVLKDSNYYKPIREFSYKSVFLWGTGNCYHRLTPYVKDIVNVVGVIDSDRKKWNKEMEYGLKCYSPNDVSNDDIFVLIMIYDPMTILEVESRLLDMGITNFEHICKWLKYYDI